MAQFSIGNATFELRQIWNGGYEAAMTSGIVSTEQFRAAGLTVKVEAVEPGRDGLVLCHDAAQYATSEIAAKTLYRHLIEDAMGY